MDQASAPANGPRPTVFHVTHWKAGSQWVRGVLSAAAKERVVPLKPDMSHILSAPIVPGGVYTPAYILHHRFVEAVPADLPKRVFVVIRDLRDTLVSWYFSLKVSHGTRSTPTVADFRASLEGLSVDDGLRLLIRDELAHVANVQASWIHAGYPVFRYEELLADQMAGFQRILDECRIRITPAAHRHIVEHFSFERRSGRQRGEEDVSSHFRKAIAGDWRNYFDDRTRTLFKERYGQLLVDTGYEKDLDW